jgi:LPS sulfotransferase NodH
MHDIIQLYSRSGKVSLINRSSLLLYRYSPNFVRQMGVYTLYHLRKSKLPPNRFVIVAQGRSGSTLLVDLMNSHPDIFTFGEIMAQNVIRNLRWPRKYAEGLCSLSRKGTVGFKAIIYQIGSTQNKDPKKVLHDFHDHGWKIIYLKRSNILRHAISDIRSAKTGTFHKVEGIKVSQEGRGARQKIRIEAEELIRTMKFREDSLALEKVVLEDLPHFTVHYETDLMGADNQRDAMNRLFEFLGLPPHDAETSFRKVTAKNIADDIENFDELREVLAESPYADYLTWD